MLIEAPISLGELVDKITILEIKQVKISDPDKLHNVKHERDVLSQKLDQLLSDDDLLKLDPLKKALKEINESLWVIEDDIRDCERDKAFGQLFIDLARSVYITNDRRAAVKKDINLAFGSELVEEKSYRDYQ